MRAPPLTSATLSLGSTRPPQDEGVGTAIDAGTREARGASRRSRGGRFKCQEVIPWKKRAREIPLVSSKADVMAVRLTGIPSAPKPQGTAIAGSPHRFPAAPTGSDQAMSLKSLSSGKAVYPSPG